MGQKQTKPISTKSLNDGSPPHYDSITSNVSKQNPILRELVNAEKLYISDPVVESEYIMKVILSNITKKTSGVSIQKNKNATVFSGKSTQLIGRNERCWKGLRKEIIRKQVIDDFSKKGLSFSCDYGNVGDEQTDWSWELSY